MIIDVTGIPKARLLAALYNNTVPMGPASLPADQEMTEAQAQTLIDQGLLTVEWQPEDWILGRPVRMDLSKDQVDSIFYDAFSRVPAVDVINALRS